MARRTGVFAAESGALVGVDTPPTATVAPVDLLTAELRISQLVRDERRLQTAAARHAAVKAELEEALASLLAEKRAAAAASARPGRIWPGGLPPEAVSATLGKPELRGHQREAVISLLDGVDTFLCWPAGGGKTHPIHVLAAMFPGRLFVVVGPLLALVGTWHLFAVWYLW